jgi:FSR family fosmidomycin resistance protein-like MFS transporter
MLAPGLLVAGLLTIALPRLSGPRTLHASSARAADTRTMTTAMGVLILVIALRSWTQIGFTTFVPFYYLDVLHGDPRMVGTLLAVFLGSGVLGTLVAGPIADRVGVRRYFVSALLLATPLAVVFLFTQGILAVVTLGALGFVLVSSFTASVVLGQAYMPRKPGLASGLAVGFAFGAGGIGASTLGWVADHWGLFAALSISAVMPAAAFCVSLLLPEPRPVIGDRYR